MRNINLSLKYNLNYSDNPDLVVNIHGRTLLELAEGNNLIPINHLISSKLEADGGYTYKQGVRWTSQLDWALCSFNALDSISSFKIDHNSRMKSNHAPIMLELGVSHCTSGSILERSRALFDMCDYSQNRMRKCIKASDIDRIKYVSVLPNPMTLFNFENGVLNIEEVCNTLSHHLYEASKKAKIVRDDTSISVNQISRWQWLMNEKDSKVIWRAINWNGTFDSVLKTQPSHAEQADYFKTLFETGVTDNLENYNNPDIYIPLLDDPVTEQEVEYGIKVIKSNSCRNRWSLPRSAEVFR